MDATRLDIRLKAAEKDLIQQAAALSSQSVTQFVLATLTEAAGRIVAEDKQHQLSNRDRDLFLALLDAPPEPAKALIDAAARYDKLRAT